MTELHVMWEVDEKKMHKRIHNNVVTIMNQYHRVNIIQAKTQRFQRKYLCLCTSTRTTKYTGYFIFKNAGGQGGAQQLAEMKGRLETSFAPFEITMSIFERCGTLEET